MTPEDLKKMETLLDLFEHEGWAIFIEEKEELQKSLIDNAYLECDSDKDWQQRRGAIVMLGSILSYEAAIRFVLEQEAQDDSEDI